MSQNNTPEQQNSEIFEELSPEEQREEQELAKRIEEINQKLAKFHAMSGGSGVPIAGPNEQQSLIENKDMPDEIKDLQLDELPAIDIRGNVVYSNEMIRKRYDESYPIIRCLQLPYCYNTIVSKVKFWTVMSFAGAYAWQAKRSIESNQGMKGIRALPLFKNYLYILGLGITFSMIESFYFEDYCDVNSFHYQDNMSRRSMAEQIKQRFKKY